MLYSTKLEEMAIYLREKLEINPEIILNPSHLNELSQKIQEHFKNFTIVYTSGLSKLILNNQKYFIMNIYGDEENRFYDLVEQFTFALLLDKKSLSYEQLHHSEYMFPRSWSACQNRAHYFMLAFMMPQKAFYSTMSKYLCEDGLTIRMYKMQENVNKYCYRRGIDLQMWP